MGAVDLGGGGHDKKKGGGVKKPKRVGFKLDMTPLVDIAFLLLTFFMFATTMSQPQIMEMRVPPDDVTDVEVKASELWTIFIRDDNQLFYNTGLNLEPKPLSLSKLVDESVQRNMGTGDGNALITVLKIDPDAEYSRMIEVLDRLNTAESKLKGAYAQENKERERRFSIIPMEEEVREELKTL
jgi:biopolymer transport protein ExbD